MVSAIAYEFNRDEVKCISPKFEVGFYFFHLYYVLQQYFPLEFN